MPFEERAATSRSPPAAVARELRREAGFGCCACGLPILQYHHIIEWADEQHFRPQDMMVLCPLHHDQATKHAMPEKEQRQLKANPFNITRHRTKGLLEVRQNYCAANFGSVTWVGDGPCLRIDGEKMLEFNLGEGNLEISLCLFSETDELLLKIERNEWVAGDPLPWDIEADWQVITIRERARKISLSLNAKEVPLEVRGQFWRNGKYIECSKDGISVGAIRVILQELALVGATIDIDMNKVSIGFGTGGSIVSWPNRRERLWKAKDVWAKLKRARSAQPA